VAAIAKTENPRIATRFPPCDLPPVCQRTRGLGQAGSAVPPHFEVLRRHSQPLQSRFATICEILLVIALRQCWDPALTATTITTSISTALSEITAPAFERSRRALDYRSFSHLSAPAALVFMA